MWMRLVATGMLTAIWAMTAWERKNPWFAGEALPELKSRIATLLSDYPSSSIRSMSSSLNPR